MAKKRFKKETKVMVKVTCQCQEYAVARQPSLLQRVQCKKCGKIFKTNRDLNNNGATICFECKNKRFKS